MPCTPLSPSTRRECLDRFAPYQAKCHSDSCRAEFVKSYKKYCGAEDGVKEDASNDNQQPKQSQTEADEQWRLVCGQASTLVQEQCTKSECQKEMAGGSLIERCAKTPQDSKQCQDVLDPLVKLCETDKCRRGLEALKSKECAARKDPVAEYDGGVVTDSDRQEDMAPITRDEWATLCNEALKAQRRSCHGSGRCIEMFEELLPELSLVCQKDRPKHRSSCENVFDLSGCHSKECKDELVGLRDKACARKSSI
ncbi:metalloprotease MEP1 [Metarhizium anisopliae]